MRVQLLSDLHFEFHRDSGQEFIKSLDPEGVDVLVLAGDICAGHRLGDVLRAFCDKYPQVVFVCGNHEFYQSSPDMVLGHLRQVGYKHENFHHLRQKKVEIDGVTFAGTTLWFPEPVGRAYEMRHWLNDYQVIRGFVPWVYHEHAAGVVFLESEAPTADIVVTHHMPANVCISERYKGNPDNKALNHFFCHDMTPLIEQGPGPKCWFYAHTHDRGRFKVGNTTLIGNPFGYPSEQGLRIRGPYTEKLVVEVG